MSANDDSGLASLIPAILRSIDHTMGADLAAEVTTANGRVLIDMVRRLVRWSVAELEQHQTLYRDRIAATTALGDQLPNMPATAPPRPPVRSPASVLSGLYATPTLAEEEYFEVAENVSATLRQDIAAAHGNREASAALAMRIRKLIEAEVRFHSALDPESAADIASAYHGGKSSAEDEGAAESPAVTLDSLNRYLRGRFPEHPAIAAANLQMLTGGMGKDTLLFELSGHPRFMGPLVMRKDLALLSIDVSAVDEFDLLEAVYSAGVAAPEPLWQEPDARQLGTPFIVVRRARGSVAIQQDISEEKIRRHFADKLAEGLAAIHRLKLPRLPMYARDAGKTMPEALRAQLDYWRGFWVRKRLEPSLKLEAIFAWLEANIPPDPGIPPTLVHADYGFHNLIMDQGEVTAILDWEFSHIGDPAEDVNYCRQFIERYVPFDYFLERYIAHGGLPYDEGRDRYFTVWRNVRNAIASIGALHAFWVRKPGNIKMATAGVAYNPRFELEALKLIAGYLEHG